MANIGRVYRDSYVNKVTKEVVKTVMLDIRTISAKHTFSISVNKLKYPDGVINGNIVAGKEEHPDYHIWANLAKRGESGWSEIVGNVRNAVSDSGLAYKRAVLFDPFLSKENIYFTLFSVEPEKKVDETHLYNVVAQPFRNMSHDNNSQNTHSAQPSYEHSATYARADGTQVPVYDKSLPAPIDVDEDEIPF
ncbi:MAG: hypothetical protein NTW78_03930 [Campylobacterales bacterium]|nr:hypothetical protein [Campylobacterales bacterium]